MKQIRLPLAALIVVLVFTLFPVAETMAESNASNNQNVFRSELDVSVKCYDRKTNSFVWKLENNDKEKVESVMWVITWKSDGEYKMANDFVPSVSPGEKVYIKTPAGDLLEMYYDDGVFMKSVSKPSFFFWCW